MIKIEVKIMDVGMGTVVEVSGESSEPTLRETVTADLMMEKIKDVRSMSEAARRIYTQRTKQSGQPPRPSHADWVDEALAEIEKAEKEVGNAGSN